MPSTSTGVKSCALLEKIPLRGNRWPEILPGLPENYQEIIQLEADVEGLIGTLVEAFPFKVRWSKFLNWALRREESMQGLCWTLYDEFIKNLKLQNMKNLLRFASVGAFLPDIKRQIQNSVVMDSSTSKHDYESTTQFEDSLKECNRKRS